MILYALKFEKHWMRRVDEIMEGEGIYSYTWKERKFAHWTIPLRGWKAGKKQTKDHASPNKNTIEGLSKEHEKNYGAFQCENQEKIKWCVHLFSALW